MASESTPAPSIVDVLRDEAIQLVDSELPSAEELRGFVGALAQRLGRLEQDVVGEVKAPPQHEPNVTAQPVEPTPYVPVVPEQSTEPAQAAPEAPQAPAGEPAPAPVVPPVASGVDEQLAQARAALAADQERVAELEAKQSSQSPASS